MINIYIFDRKNGNNSNISSTFNTTKCHHEVACKGQAQIIQLVGVESNWINITRYVVRAPSSCHVKK